MAAPKQSSSPIVISRNFKALSGFVSEQVDLMLNALDQEVFVVTGVDYQWHQDDDAMFTGTPAVPAFIRCSISSTLRDTVGGLGDTNVIADATYSGSVQDLANGGPAVWAFTQFGEQLSGNTIPADLDYIALIATSDFFINSIKDVGFSNDQNLAVRVYGYRATVDGPTYAALVQSQVLSS